MTEIVMHQSHGDIGWCIYKNRKRTAKGVVKGDNPNGYADALFKATIQLLSDIPVEEAITIDSPHVHVLTRKRKQRERTELFLEFQRCIEGRKITYNIIRTSDERAEFAKKLASDQRKLEAACGGVIPKYIAYTDGSCNNLSPYGEGGAAYVILQGGKNGVEIATQNSKGFIKTTNNRMELLAIISAVSWIPDGESIIIVTDSQYCINVLDQVVCPRTIQKNEDLIHKYYQIRQSKGKVIFDWVKGHSGDKYNEMVDSLAYSRREEMRVAHNIPVYTHRNSPKCQK